jgi:WD40 repeat protein
MAEVDIQLQSSGQRQIPIVCPGHTRPLAEVQFCSVLDKTNEGESRRILLLSACHDKLPMMRDGLSGDWIGTFEGHKGAVWSCRVDPMANLAATASGDFTARVWDAITGDCLYLLPHKHIVKTCDFSLDSTKLATGGHEGLLRIYDLASLGKPDPNKNIEETLLSLPQISEGQDKVSNVNVCFFMCVHDWYFYLVFMKSRFGSN